MKRFIKATNALPERREDFNGISDDYLIEFIDEYGDEQNLICYYNFIKGLWITRWKLYAESFPNENVKWYGEISNDTDNFFSIDIVITHHRFTTGACKLIL